MRAFSSAGRLVDALVFVGDAHFEVHAVGEFEQVRLHGGYGAALVLR